jgi:hypothetical protein
MDVFVSGMQCIRSVPIELNGVRSYEILPLDTYKEGKIPNNISPSKLTLIKI